MVDPISPQRGTAPLIDPTVNLPNPPRPAAQPPAAQPPAGRSPAAAPGMDRDRSRTGPLRPATSSFGLPGMNPAAATQAVANAAAVADAATHALTSTVGAASTAAGGVLGQVYNWFKDTANAAVNAAANAANSVLHNAPGAQPGAQPGTQPGTQPGSQPGSQPGTPPASPHDGVHNAVQNFVQNFPTQGPQAGNAPDRQRGRDYVATHDPIQGTISSGGATAHVSLGGDPGNFYCGDQTKRLADFTGANPGTIAGFIHVPPDMRTEAARQNNPNTALPTRAQNMDMTAQLLGKAVAGIADAHPGQDTTVLMTGFGPFQGGEDNPTQAFMHDAQGQPNRANMDRLIQHGFGVTPNASNSRPITGPDGNTVGYSYDVGGRRVNLVPGVMNLASSDAMAKGGHYDMTPAQMNAQFQQLDAVARSVNGGHEPQGIISLGMDGTQLDNTSPDQNRFKIETQAQGFNSEVTGADGFERTVQAANFSQAPVANTRLAEVVARRMGVRGTSSS